MGKFFNGADILVGSNTIPGVKMPEELKRHASTILKACEDYGLDFFPTNIQLMTYDDISEIAAYGGFPVRYPHWSWGMEYEKLQRGYELNMGKIHELVINANPNVMYCLFSNSLLDNLTVIAHATGHNDFFKNNIFFEKTNRDAVNLFANHATRIRKYMDRWGKEKVTEFIDHVNRLQTLIDPATAWEQKQIKDLNIQDSKTTYPPRRFKIDQDRLYMDDFINNKKFIDQDNLRIAKKEIEDEMEIFKSPTKDILGYLRDHAPLKPWQQDVISMLHEEAMYFYPQRITQCCNEAMASFVDYEIMARQGYCTLGQETDSSGIVEYSDLKWRVLGGKYSMNPYKTGFSIFLDIEERWNKGQFGLEWDNCTDANKKKNWDTKANLGKEKIFEVRKFYNDYLLIDEFFTEDFCIKNEYFEWEKLPNGEYVISNRDYHSIKNKLKERYLNGGLPEIHLVDDNHKGKDILFLEHLWTGKTLYERYLKSVLSSIEFIWGRGVVLATKNKHDQEVVCICKDKDVYLESRESYESSD